MVLFKRKPVQFVPEPDVDDDQEVWTIAQTGEIFVTYEQYLTRLDFYNQKRFICPITGHSGLSFFEALQSELAGAAEVEQAFPEALKEPILRSVQFQTVSRIDTLVDQIYDKFKNDYYPHEAVTVNTIGGERLHGVVRDKTRFGSKVLPDGTTTKPFSRYFVSLDERPNDEAVVDDTHIFRDRKVFTKSVLRSFIKKTVTREAWNGAPWLVKPDVAERYQIDTRVPLHLRHDTKLAERKQLQLQKRHSMGDPNGSNSGSFSPTGPVRLPELKPAPKSHKSKAQQAQQAQGHGGKSKQQNVLSGPEPGKFVHLPLPGNPFQFPPLSYRNQEISPAYSQPELPPPPPPPKYPIEDLQLPPRGRVRPTMKYLCNDPPVDIETEAKHPLGGAVLMKSVGPLLETWDTLNVYAEIFKLDSFTFDDFVEALHIASDEAPVELFTEIHCAVLKILVSAEEDGGKPQIRLPELDDEQDEEEEEEEETEQSPDPEPQPSGRATRSSMAKLEAERLAAEAAEAEKSILEAENAPKHRAEELLNGYNWVEQLAKREFKDGGWEMIMVGLLHQLSKNERQKDKCEVLLQHLVPTELEEPTQETVRQQYAELDINLRVQALQIICMLTSETRAIRMYMEECANQMTGFRKDKIELQRTRKQCIEDLKSLNDERKILLPDNLPISPPLDPVTTNGDVKMSDVDDLQTSHLEEEVQDSEDDNAIGGRKLRRAQDRILERKRRAEKEQERKERAEAAAKVPKQSKQFIKVIKDIQKKEKEIAELEAKIAEIDNDLREADCPRTRVLGKDRFWNRYYWFERNGMPYAGLPTSSTADAEYANGCIWVQGPDELEREGYIDMEPKYQNEYKSKFDMTVPERKKMEEGPTSVYNAYQWGFYSEPEDVDKLLDWLDPRGFNELKLRKEIVMYRDRIATHMEARKTYVGPVGGVETNGVNEEEEAEKKRQEEIAAAAAAVKGGKRMSTRGRATAAHTPEASAPKTKYRCLKWHNTTAIEDLNHLHSEQPAPVRSRKQTKRKSEAIASAIVAEGSEPATTRGKKARQSRG